MSSEDELQEFKYGYKYEVPVLVEGYNSKKDAASDKEDDYFGVLGGSEMEEGDPEDGILRLTFRGTFTVEETPDHADQGAENKLRTKIPELADITDLTQL